MFVKVRPYPAPDSIPGLLRMFENEVRFYREVAPDVGVRVPRCFAATDREDGYRLELEDLSAWTAGGDPVAVAAKLAVLHRRWEGVAEQRWPWLDRAGRAAEAIGGLYDARWAEVRSRPDVSASVRAAGDRLLGRVAELERAESIGSGRRTLLHGDASLRNVRESPTGEVVLFDWEDVRLGDGPVDLTWLLVSSVDPGRWDDVIGSYGLRSDEVLGPPMEANLAQAILALADEAPGSAEAAGWVARIERAREL